MRGRLLGCCFLCVGFTFIRAGVCQDDSALLGGSATVNSVGPHAYELMSPAITAIDALIRHDAGETGFRRDFSRVKIGGKIRLGPTFNAVSCVRCHGGNGRGALRVGSGPLGSDTVVKVSLPGGHGASHGGPAPVPGIGLQIRDHATHGNNKEGRVAIHWLTVLGAYDDGTKYELREPRVIIRGLPKRSPRRFQTSLRRAPPVIGQGLIDAIPAQSIEANADPSDADGDGISGRVNTVWDVQARSFSVGRFGFKAGSPSLKQQIAAAYATDMGVTNPLFRLRGERPEISSRILEATTFYAATLGVPMARDQTLAAVTHGRELFNSLGCAHCHVATFVTDGGADSSLANQIIHPFSDFLLHDMGVGLSDNRSEFAASGEEWRTTPLWGIGLTEDVLNGEHATYMHDGRARSLEEAILWHGGEASAARSQFTALQASERDSLIQFLRSL